MNFHTDIYTLHDILLIIYILVYHYKNYERIYFVIPDKDYLPIISPPTEQTETVDISTSTSLKCNFKSDIFGNLTNITKIEWIFKDNYNVESTLINSTKYQIVTSPRESRLTINDFGPEDKGSYYCRVTNSYGSTEQALTTVTIAEG